jgi:hypothetical protein
MAIPGSGRPALLGEELLERLRACLGFRHMYRHSCTFQLQWAKMQPLVERIEETLQMLETSLKSFADA